MAPHKHLNLLDIYAKFIYEWHFSNDHMRWQTAARLLLGNLKFYETGTRFTSHIDIKNYEQRINAVYNHVNHQKEFSHTYPLCVQEDQCCTILEQGKLVFSPQGAPIKIAGSIEPVSKPVSLKSPKTKKDTLTGILNKFGLSEQLSDMQNMKLSKPTTATLLQINFVQTPLVGIRYGVEKMNAVVKQLSDCLQNAIRDQDILGRISGASFGLILPESNTQEMIVVAKKLIDVISNASIKINENEPNIQISASGGIPFSLGAKIPVNKIFESAESALMNAQSIKMLAVTVPGNPIREEDKDNLKAKKRGKSSPTRKTKKSVS